MSWREFTAYMKGIDGKTPLGRIASIRAEEDPEVIKNFTPEQKRIRSQWLTRQAKQKPQAEVDRFLTDMQTAFARIAGTAAESR